MPFEANKTDSLSQVNKNYGISIEAKWKEIIGGEFDKPHMHNLKKFLQQEVRNKKIIFPPSNEVFAAFNCTPFDTVKVVIIGQDPYHGPGQAHGLSFSVKPGIRLPPSLMNIYKELESDLGIKPASHGFLKHWADQGVLLLNSVLTVEAGKAASHQKRGWEEFTDAAIASLNEKRNNLVFILWGTSAQKKGARIDRRKHHVIESVHPSPLSAHRGFLGSKPFSKTNNFLRSKNLPPIDWRLPDSGLKG